MYLITLDTTDAAQLRGDTPTATNFAVSRPVRRSPVLSRRELRRLILDQLG